MAAERRHAGRESLARLAHDVQTVAGGLYRRHFAGTSMDALAQWSAPAQSQVPMAGPTPMTMAAMVASTAMSPAALGTAARRMLRSTGPLISRALAGLEVAAAGGTSGGGAVLSEPTVPSGPSVPTSPTVPTGPIPIGPTIPIGPIPIGPTIPSGPTGPGATHPTGPIHPDPIGPIHPGPLPGGHPPVQPLAHPATEPAELAVALAPIGDGPGHPHLPNGDGPIGRPPTGGTTGGSPGPGGTHTGPGGIHGGHGPVITGGGGVIVVSQSPPSDAPPGLVTLERVRSLMGGPADLANFGLDGLTSALVRQRSLLRIASALVDENGASSGLPPNSHSTFAAAAEPTQDAVLAQLTTARRPPVAVTVATIDHTAVLAALDPSPRFQAIATRRVTAPGPASDRDPLAAVTLAPSFPQAAVDSLVTIAPELLLPGLDAVTTNTVTLASTDQRFVEAFLLGMNHELDRELRWRGYPTVPGATYFRRFWDTAPGHTDIDDIGNWAPDSALGTHAPANSGGSDTATGADTVLVVRGDLVRRYPGIAVTAIPLVNGAPATDPAAELSPVLRGTLDPDVLYAGFAFPPAQAANFAYVLTQQPGAPRFGLDEQSDADAASVAVRNDLAWSQLGADVQIATAAGPLAGRTLTDGGTASAVWGRNSATWPGSPVRRRSGWCLPGPELLSGMGTGSP